LTTPEPFDELRADQFIGSNRDGLRRDMTVYRKGIAGPTDDVVTEARTYHTNLLPGFVLPLSKLLVKAHQWDRKKDRPKQPRTPNPPAGGTDG